MLLAAVHIFGPIAAVRILVVQQSADAQLLGGRSVPAGPVARARSFMAENAVQPVTVFRWHRSVCKIKDIFQNRLHINMHS